ncbi:isocitrate lyase/PEP mutase family protein [Methanobacterium subterraneum]|uniref:Isocitrate lyase/PEP mutase family protein n=1 Tax=Methanobacterium subterraneum TaxID=59277 RepID=A0A7K4DLR1_9EURY|nr:isocitrate lyase/PEP mutase family protein [Methanobacterium subterraneum]MBW4256116.1 isocitrate lyase/PEP mutase family protein [Methanobacterium sp. YSL]NMO09288.1 isocitrate lyase/PEP mutase family protein [Methanobacterium subterraneum]
MNKSKLLRDLILDKETLIMPNAYDPISARMIEKAGFKAVQCSGYSFSIQAAYPRESNITRDDNLKWTRRIVEAVDVPVMADAEDGYGDIKTIPETVEKFMKVGVAGLNLEDQILGKPGPLEIVDEEVMVQKITLAREAAEVKGNSDLVINGRTDTLKSTPDREEALNIAIERANAYLDAGATLAFIVYTATMEEVLTITREVKGPVTIAAGMPYNLHNFSISDLKKCGVARISLPSLLIYSSLKSMQKALKHVKMDEMEKLMDNDDLYSVEDLNKLL